MPIFMPVPFGLALALFRFDGGRRAGIQFCLALGFVGRTLLSAALDFVFCASWAASRRVLAQSSSQGRRTRVSAPQNPKYAKFQSLNFLRRDKQTIQRLGALRRSPTPRPWFRSAVAAVLGSCRPGR